MKQKSTVNTAPGNSINRMMNLRQHLLRASRVVNNAIVENLHQCGFTELRSTHTALLSNLNLDGNSITKIAQRAGMSKQAMGRLADELITLKYISKIPSEHDKRAYKLKFTTSGFTLMKHSFSIMKKLENRCATRLGDKHFIKLLCSLQGIVDEFDISPDYIT